MIAHARERLPVIRDLGELADMACNGADAYLRYSRGWEADAHHTSRDYESGLELPGLSVIPLAPPAWWRRPVSDWVARQVCKYIQLTEDDRSKFGWVLTGRVVGRGPDSEPLVAAARPLAVLSEDVVEQARRHYHEHFDVGRDSRG